MSLAAYNTMIYPYYLYLNYYSCILLVFLFKIYYKYNLEKKSDLTW